MRPAPAAAAAIRPGEVTGLVLAGGRGSRMGGADKGLLTLQGVPLALHAARRLQPQVGRAAINANRSLDLYAAFGFPVWPDATGALHAEETSEATEAASFLGPLAGLLAGLQRCDTPWLACVPCDSPDFPTDLVARLAAACVREQVPLAVACARDPDDPAAAADPPASLMLQPVFCLLHASLQASLAHHLADGGRRAGAWIASLPHARVAFDTPGDDPQAFANLNTPQDWVRRQVRQKARQPVATVPQRPPLTP